MSASLRVLVLALVVVLAVAAALALTREPDAVEVPAPAGAEIGGFRALETASADAAPALLARSPFAPDRSAYAREQSPPAAPPAPLEVRLVALFAVQGAPRATLMIGGQEVTVGVGDATPAGVVADIEADAVVLGEGAGRRVSLFD